ncbi:response regulator transcription factor [Pseudonocardia spinosispora]|uniref:response regulator transcription factor n=1 Tax=Pseudonocardia spinosispora TaxID=103441 RepID=UPI0003FCAEB8|nr:response regulator transcription factor [Pseudonocardia spinosispora]
MPNNPITVLVADDQALVRGGLVAMLDLEPDLTVVAEVARGDDVLAAVVDKRPDVALLDVQMPGLDGLEVARLLRESAPGCRVIICTTFGRPGYFSRAMAAGAAGFVLKDAPPEQLVDAIRRVHAGLRAVDPALAADAMAIGANPLTDREQNVLRAAGEGRTAAEIAKALHLSHGTVRNHLSSAIGKTDAVNSADAVRIAENNGWL